MKLFRFMSKTEFDKYLSGDVLINKTNHHVEHNQKTNSIGFCFLDLNEYKPEEAIHFLSGIVDMDICAVFDVDEKYVDMTHGRYAKQGVTISLYDIFMGTIPSFEAKEYCTTEYSNKNFKLIKYAVPEWKDKKQWEWKIAEQKEK